MRHLRLLIKKLAKKPHLSIVAAALVALLALQAPACVETADCDKNITCPTGELCFRKFCKPACEANDDCGGPPLRCVACEGNCIGGTGKVCINPAVCEPRCQEGEFCVNGACTLDPVLE